MAEEVESSFAMVSSVPDEGRVDNPPPWHLRMSISSIMNVRDYM